MKRNAIFALLDQALVSATNFLIGLFFVHYATKEDYGLYAIGFGIVSLAISFGAALITTPMTVLAPCKNLEDQRIYCSTMLTGQYVLMLPAALLSVIASWIGFYAGLFSLDIFCFCIAVTMATFGVLLLEFFRRYNYLRMEPKRVFWIDVRFSFMMIGMLGALELYGKDSLYLWVILSYGIAAGLSGFYAYLSAGFMRLVVWSFVRQALSGAWQHGRWALGGVMITWIQNQSYAYFLAWLTGAASVAEANAGRLLLSPASMLGTSMMNIFMPRMVHLKADDKPEEAVRLGRRALGLLIIATIIYAGCVFFARDWLIHTVLTKEYSNVGPYIFAWTVVILFQAMRANSSALLQVFREFRAITVANALSALIVILSTGILITLFGVIGSIAALALGELILAVLLWRAFARVRSKNPS